MVQTALECNCKVLEQCLLLAVRRFFIDKEGIYLVYYNEMWFLSAFVVGKNHLNRGVLEVRAGKSGSLTVCVFGCRVRFCDRKGTPKSGNPAESF